MTGRRGSVVMSAVAAGGLLALLPHLLGPLDEPRRTFVALRYLASARKELQGRPVDRSAAARSIKRSLALAPQDPLIASSAGGILMQAEDYEAAVDVLLRQELTSPHDTITLAHALLMAGRGDEGSALILRTVEAVHQSYRAKETPRLEYALLLNNAAYALTEGERDVMAARALADMAVRVAPLEPAFCDTLGWALFKLQETDRATFYLERAARQSLSRPDPVVLYHLGCAYGAQNRRSEARRFLAWSLALDPGREDALRMLRHLYRALPTPGYAAAPRRDDCRNGAG